MRWIEVEPACGPWRFIVPLAGIGGRGFSANLDLWLDPQLDQAELTHDDMERLQCFLLIARLKDRGLGEAVQSLRDMVDFYVEEPPPALPPAPRVPIRARVSGAYTSTVPPISEE